VKPAPFEYVAPRSLDEAVAELERSDGDAKLLAGGQSLVPLLNMRLASPARLIDLNRVPELAYLRERDGGLAVGAMTRAAAVEREPRLAEWVPLLAEALPWVGHPPIRSRGTVGGSLAHADPAAELPAVAVCLDARLTARGPRGERRIAAGDFFTGYFGTALAADEVLTEVWFPRPAPATGQAWVEFARRHGDYAIVGVGASITLDARRAIAEARLTLIGVGPAPVRPRGAEGVLVGRRYRPELGAAAAQAVGQQIDPDDDIHGSKAYRRRLAAALVERALGLAHARALGGGDGRSPGRGAEDASGVAVAEDIARTFSAMGRRG
jgi:aerobic carbon-monoxide dehydrogenase medium subunit